jgi:Carboxypeptidase regulatory-like domain/TonB-dependent Receptor Plug Domain
MMLKRILPLFISFFFFPFLMNAQITTSSMTGFVKTTTADALTGATVNAVHQPTGSVYKVATSTGGRFDINNMNPGGPYTVTITFVNYETVTRDDVYLSLGEVSKQDFQLANKATELTSVTITTNRPTQGRGGGTGTVIGRDKMENMPTVGRNLSDYLRATPQLKLSSAGQPSSEGAMSFAGQNVRYNSFYIDGAVNNDVFGLAYSGTNGGQSSISPISVDAIDQFQVLISPYDASVGSFTGGAINAITKSGTNQVHGSAYYLFRNSALTGKTPTGEKSLAKKANIDNKTYGVTLGGPIIKNKLFYFVSGEMQRDQNPNPFTLSTYQGTTKDPALFKKLVDTIKARAIRSGYGPYDPGGYENNVGEVQSDKVTAKLDWNINTSNKLALSYRYTGGTKLSVFASTPTAINFYKSGFNFPSKTNSASAELKSTLGKNSNRLLLTFTKVEDDRGPIGGENPFPSIQIFDGTTPSIFFSTDASSVFNYLKQNTYNLVDHFKFNLGKNSITTGVEGEYYKAYNTFIQNTVGAYRYSNLQDFFDNKKPNQYVANFPLIGGTNEKNTAAAAKFDVFKGGAFINDEIHVNQNLTITAGVRFDYYKFITTPIFEQFVIDSALPKVSAYYNLKGAYPGKIANVPLSFSPRVGFTYQVPDENATIRGGFGWFAGRIPQVWPGGVYNNTGVSSGGYTLNASTNTAIWNKDLVRFRTTAYTPAELGISLDNAKGQLNLIAKDFSMPKVFRTSLGFDQRIGKGWSYTFELMYTKNVNDIYYQNVNLLPPTLKMAVGPDTRNVYPSPSTIPIRSSGINPYSGIYVIENAQGQKPFSYNFTFSINKTSIKGFNFNLSYNYGESQVLNEAQSSTNSSQWSSQETINGRNYLTLSNSDNSVGHRIFSYFCKKFFYANKKLSTTIALTYTGQSGQPFSYTYNGSVVRDGIIGNDLLYIPTSIQLADPGMTFITTAAITALPADQKTAFEAFIQNDKYLRNHRSQYAQRNASRTPFTHIVDLRLAEDFNIKARGKTYSAEVGYNMFNFTNFLNRNWGRQYFVNNDQYQLVTSSYTSATNLTPRYTFNPTTPKAGTPTTSLTPSYSSRWLSQLEFRIKF